jgi:hypothetical protein
MMNPEAVVWRDDVHRSKWWARIYKDGRCVWLMGGFKSSKKAQLAVDRILGR